MTEGSSILIVFTGLPASGKSSVASRLLALRRGVHLSTDETRERMFPRRAVGAALKYADASSARVYEEVEARARAALREATPLVILDGTYLRPTDRSRAIALGLSEGAEVLVLEVWAAEAVITARLRARTPGAEHHSEADLEVYRAMCAKLEDPTSGYRRVSVAELESQPGDKVVGAGFDTGRGECRVWFGTPSHAARSLLEGLESGFRG